MRILRLTKSPLPVEVIFVFFLLLTLFLLALPLAAQPPGRGGPQYDRKAEVEWRGTVTEVEFHESPPGFLGVHLQGTNDDGPMEIHAGPSSFLEAKEFAFRNGDVLVVVGSKVTWRGKSVLLARQIVRGDVTLELRDDKGNPLWPAPPPPPPKD